MQKALFLDRDGVINVEKDYLYKIEDFEFIDGIIQLCKHYQTNGYQIFVVTNQSGIAREYYTEEDFSNLTDWMINEFKNNDINIIKVYHCPHHPSISGDCSCRKPHAGMLLSAEEEYNIDLKKSIIIGDKERDIEAGLNAGLQETYLFDDSKKIINSKATKIVSKLEDIYKC
ncbi:D-glycero-beta-D-manno-heptose 1,7-bisphosphate 7-phosphatase [Sulfurimonas sp.]